MAFRICSIIRGRDTRKASSGHFISTKLRNLEPFRLMNAAEAKAAAVNIREPAKQPGSW